MYQAIVYGSDVQQEGLLRFAATPDAINCGTDLLFRRTPRFVPDTFAAQAGESTAERAVRLATRLDRTTLAIQGPPGAGKTYVGAQMIPR